MTFNLFYLFTYLFLILLFIYFSLVFFFVQFFSRLVQRPPAPGHQSENPWFRAQTMVHFRCFSQVPIEFSWNEATDWRRAASVRFTWRVLAVSALVVSSTQTAGPSDALADNRTPSQKSQTIISHVQNGLDIGIPRSFCDFHSECPSASPAGCFSMWNKQQMP